MDKVERRRQYIKGKKAEERSRDALTLNGMLYMLFTECGVTLNFKRTRTAKKNIKFCTPYSIVIGNQEFTLDQIREFGKQFLMEVYGFKTNNSSSHTNDALVVSGVMYLLHCYGYTFSIKSPKDINTRKDAPILRVESIAKNNVVYSLEVISLYGSTFMNTYNSFRQETIFSLNSDSFISTIANSVITNDYNEEPTFILIYNYCLQQN